ncbi:gastrula-specific protein 17 [Drosophila tropicalis]|uniref:gastrula-specific protein 17 n=1 Tax=Drosophila tropicalis TaxID=46794 RepID=UPI0035AB8785
MGTPRRNYNFSHQTPGQYPSQSAEYMSHHAGGGIQNPRQQQQNFGFYEDKRAYGGGNHREDPPSKPHFYQNRTPHEQRQGQGGRFFGRGNRGPHRPYQHRGGGQHRDSGNAFSQYYHPSMLEDPWRDLMARHNAIHNIKAQSEQSDS